MRNKLLLFALESFFLLSSFMPKVNGEIQPKTITRSLTLINGNEVEKTVILLDGKTSREDIIHTCVFLAHENVQLTFDKLIIGNSFLGIIGKKRIRIAEGKIALSSGAAQTFKAGGATSFNFIKIQYSKNIAKKLNQIEMIEIID